MRKEPKYVTPREREQRLNARGTIAVCAVVLIMFVLSIATVMHLVRTDTPTDSPTKFDMHDSMTVTRTFDGEKIRWYVMTDPDTQVQYVVNDRGGCCPRLDEYGRVMGTHEETEDEVVDDEPTRVY